MAIIALLLCVTTSAARSKFPFHSGYNGWYGTIGAAIGQETFIGAPKLGIYREQAWKHGSFGRGYRHSACYAGVEGSALAWIGTGIYTAGINIGFRYQSFTLDNSLSRTIVTNTDMLRIAWYNSCNPKLGYHFGPVWIKAGPSFWLKGNADWGSWMKMGSVPLNLEVHYVQKIR